MIDRKGTTMALSLVVTAVILIVISLVIITIVTGGLSQFAGSQSDTVNETGSAIGTQAGSAYCNAQKSVSCQYCKDAKYNGVDCSEIVDCGDCVSSDDS